MRYLISLLILMLSSTAFAQTGFFSNPERDGEGMIVTVKGDLLAFAFFTYWDGTITIPPQVSPLPPDPPEDLYVNPSCTAAPQKAPVYDIPPMVSPLPPPLPETEPRTYYGGAQAWFFGFGTYLDNIAIGKMYYHKAIDYPYVWDNNGLSNEYVIGNFLIEGYKGGFDLYIDCSNLVPKSLFMCNNVYQFRKLVIGG